MEECKWRGQARRARRWNTGIFLLFSIAAAALLTALGIFIESRRFTAEKWLEAPEDRNKIVADLLDRYTLIGMTQQEVFALLGEETSYANAKTSFKINSAHFAPGETLVYYLGVDYMDGRWLILPMEDGVVTACHIDVT